jgi:REP element-mobilizing transposase RayT
MILKVAQRVLQQKLFVNSSTKPKPYITMPQSIASVQLHIVFSTKHRQNLIDDHIEDRLFNYLGGICNELKCNSIKVGGYRNHVHIFCMYSRQITISKLLQSIKQSSSLWIKTVDEKYSNFYWQDGYAVFSVDEARHASLVEYIENQRTNHQKIGFKDELRGLFKKHNVEFDERYVWD